MIGEGDAPAKRRRPLALTPGQQEMLRRAPGGTRDEAGGDGAGAEVARQGPGDLGKRYDRGTGRVRERRRELRAGVGARDDEGRRDPAECGERPARLGCERRRVVCRGDQRTETGDPSVAPDAECAPRAVGEEETGVGQRRRKEVPGGKRSELDAQRGETGRPEEGPMCRDIGLPGDDGQDGGTLRHPPERLVGDEGVLGLVGQLPEQLEPHRTRQTSRVAGRQDEEAVGHVRAAIAAYKAMPDDSVSLNNGALAYLALYQLTSWARQANVELEDLRAAPLSLEDVYLRLSDAAEEDAAP